MKYTTKEERLANLIKKYITHRVGDTVKPIFEVNGPSIFGNYWRGDDDVIYFWTISSGDSFVIDKDLYFGVMNMFNMKNEDSLFLFRSFYYWFSSAQDLIKLQDECTLDWSNLKDMQYL